MSGPQNDRYRHLQYRRCGRSGLRLPAISLGLWQNFGGEVPIERGRAIVRRAFDLGIMHLNSLSRLAGEGQGEGPLGVCRRRSKRL